MEMGERKRFMVLLVMSQAAAIVMVAMTIVWTSKVLEGFAWDGTSKQFNLHPLCMVCGFIFLYGEAALAFRVFSQHTKSYVKIIHGVFHILAFIAAVIGLKAVFAFHNHGGIPNMYSLHSWCGLTTVLLFSLQFTFGFLSFFWPGAVTSIREAYLPVHRYFGLGILFLSAISTISGITEKLFFKFDDEYSQLPSGSVIGNILGLSVLAYVFLVGYILHNPEWKRPDGAEADSLARFARISHTETDEE